MAVRTGEPGPTGLSLLIVPLLNQPGVSMRRMKTMGSQASGTTYIELEDVKVPVGNLIGQVTFQRPGVLKFCTWLTVSRKAKA